MTSSHSILTCNLEAISSYRVCVGGVVSWCAATHSSQLCPQWHHTGSLTLAMRGVFIPQQLADVTNQASSLGQLVDKYSPTCHCHFLTEILNKWSSRASIFLSNNVMTALAPISQELWRINKMTHGKDLAECLAQSQPPMHGHCQYLD